MTLTFTYRRREALFCARVSALFIVLFFRLAQGPARSRLTRQPA